MATELYRLVISGRTPYENMQNVLHFQGDNLTANNTQNNANFLIDAWRANIEALWLACLPDTYILDNYQASRSILKPTATGHHQYDLGQIAGSVSAAITSDQLCPAVLFLPPMGVKAAGKTFMPCVYSGAVAGNQYIGSYLTDILALFTPMINGFTTSAKTWHLAIYSRKLNSYSLAVGVRLSSRFGFQSRRRKPV